MELLSALTAIAVRSPLVLVRSMLALEKEATLVVALSVLKVAVTGSWKFTVSVAIPPPPLNNESEQGFVEFKAIQSVVWAHKINSSLLLLSTSRVMVGAPCTIG